MLRKGVMLCEGMMLCEQTWLPSPDHDHEPRFGDHERAIALLGS